MTMTTALKAGGGGGGKSAKAGGGGGGAAERNVAHLKAGGTLAYTAGSGQTVHARLVGQEFGLKQLNIINPATGRKVASTGLVNNDALRNAVAHLGRVRRLAR